MTACSGTFWLVTHEPPLLGLFRSDGGQTESGTPGGPAAEGIG